MNNKIIKNLLFLLIIIAFSLQISAVVIPICSFSTEDLYDDISLPEQDIIGSWQIEYTLLYHHFKYSDTTLCKIGEPPIYNEQYFILYVIPITVVSEGYTNEILISAGSHVRPLDFSKFIGPIFLSIALLLAFFYVIFSFNSLININKKKTKAPLFAGIVGIIVASSIVLGVYLVHFFQNPLYGIEKQNYVRLGLGFYYLFASSILYILVYFLQNKFYITDENGNVIGFKEKNKMNIKTD